MVTAGGTQVSDWLCSNVAMVVAIGGEVTLDSKFYEIEPDVQKNERLLW